MLTCPRRLPGSSLRSACNCCQSLTGARQADRSSVALEEALPTIFFHPLQRAADRRQAQVHLLSRAAEAEVVGEGEKQLERANIHGSYY